MRARGVELDFAKGTGGNEVRQAHTLWASHAPCLAVALFNLEQTACGSAVKLKLSPLGTAGSE